jgi:hypothetical protein
VDLDGVASQVVPDDEWTSIGPAIKLFGLSTSFAKFADIQVPSMCVSWKLLQIIVVEVKL